MWQNIPETSSSIKWGMKENPDSEIKPPEGNYLARNRAAKDIKALMHLLMSSDKGLTG